MANMANTNMADTVRLRDVVDTDLEVFFEQEQDEEAGERANFPPRDRERFMTHWRTRVLGVPDNFVQAVEVDGELAGNVLAWTQDGRRFLGYWFGRPFWGRRIGTLAVAEFLRREPTRPLYADPAVTNTFSVRLLERLGFERLEIVTYGDRQHVMLVLPPA